MAVRVNQGIVEERIVEIYSLLIKGWSFTDIRRFCRQNYQINSHRTTDKYIAKAREMMRVSNAHTLEQRRDEQTERLLIVYKTCYELGKYREANDALKEINRINGLNEKIITIKHDDKNETLLKELLNGSDGE